LAPALRSISPYAPKNAQQLLQLDISCGREIPLDLYTGMFQYITMEHPVTIFTAIFILRVDLDFTVVMLHIPVWYDDVVHLQ